MEINLKAFESFSDEGRVWVYQADRAFSVEERQRIEQELGDFVNQWTAHGAKLTATGALPTNYHVVIAVDGDVQASGCSIDASVRFVKSIGQTFQIDFFNRLKVLVEENGEWTYVPFAQTRTNQYTQCFNPMVQTVGDLRKNWCIPSDRI